MINYDRHNEMKDLSTCVYRGNEKYKPGNYIEIETRTNPKNGFSATVFYNGKDIVITYKGSDDAADFLGSDRDMIFGNIPSQSVDAINLRNEYAKVMPGQNIVLTRHSLGGSLAQIVGGQTGDETVTFNAYGTGNYVRNKKKLRQYNKLRQ